MFFVILGGFDMHDDLVAQHPGLIGKVADAMRAFYDTTVALGVADKVTDASPPPISAARSVERRRSDHGWGSHHFVHGRRGQGPALLRHRRRRSATAPPTMSARAACCRRSSVDQYAATLASWFGVGTGDMSTVLPNIGNYNPTNWNLGFV